MVDEVGNREASDYGLGIPQRQDGYGLKGLEHADWGIKNRMGRIFDPQSGNTVMLAFDHGYIMGPTSGLERIDLTILPLIELSDCIMCTRGVLRANVPPATTRPIALRFSAGTTILGELNDECILDIDEALRLNVSAIAVMVAVGGKYEAKTVANLVRAADLGARYGIPTLGVTAVGKELTRDSRYLSLAARVCAENGATFVKTYWCDQGFEKVTASCPVPIVIAGGKKLPELEALTMAWRAVQEGASGVDMGRNVFQSDHPVAMLEAVRGVVHRGLEPEAALELFRERSRS